MPKVGAHVSAAISLSLAFERARNLGAECMQIFISPPGQWAQSIHSEKEVRDFLDQANKTQIGPNFIHAAYLINLGSINPLLVQKSISWLNYAQDQADKLHLTGTIFHIGSYKGGEINQTIKQVSKSIEQILSTKSNASLILENSAGAGELIGDQFEEIGQIVKTVQDKRVKVCLDTQHAFASGYDIRTKGGLEKTLEEFDREIGLDKLAVVHINDSKTELGSKRDRHENIGEGFIGLEGFKNIIQHSAFTNTPFILEVPGFSGTGPDQDNIKLLRSLFN